MSPKVLILRLIFGAIWTTISGSGPFFWGPGPRHPPWGTPSRSWEHLGTILGPSWAHFGSSWAHLESSWRNLEQLFMGVIDRTNNIAHSARNSFLHLFYRRNAITRVTANGFGRYLVDDGRIFDSRLLGASKRDSGHSFFLIR